MTQPAAAPAAVDRGFRAKLMFILNDKSVWFAGEHALVEGPLVDVRWFTDIDEALARVRDTIMLNARGVTQVRIIGADFET